MTAKERTFEYTVFTTDNPYRAHEVTVSFKKEKGHVILTTVVDKETEKNIINRVTTASYSLLQRAAELMSEQ